MESKWELHLTTMGVGMIYTHLWKNWFYSLVDLADQEILLPLKVSIE